MFLFIHYWDHGLYVIFSNFMSTIVLNNMFRMPKKKNIIGQFTCVCVFSFVSLHIYVYVLVYAPPNRINRPSMNFGIVCFDLFLIKYLRSCHRDIEYQYTFFVFIYFLKEINKWFPAEEDTNQTKEKIQLPISLESVVRYYYCWNFPHLLLKA